MCEKQRNEVTVWRYRWLYRMYYFHVNVVLSMKTWIEFLLKCWILYHVFSSFVEDYFVLKNELDKFLYNESKLIQSFSWTICIWECINFLSTLRLQSGSKLQKYRKNMMLPIYIACIEDHSNTADGGSVALSVDLLRSRSARRVEIKAKTVSS